MQGLLLQTLYGTLSKSPEEVTVHLALPLSQCHMCVPGLLHTKSSALHQ